MFNDYGITQKIKLFMEENESLNIAIIDDNEGDIIIIKKHLQKYFPNAAFVTADSKKHFWKNTMDGASHCDKRLQLT
ncbi:MAG: hypothetical protein IPN72_17465 [Saprospiraceae bacterium]|nr:hypothetical protein [Saprospiraceae bacterium]